MAPEPRVSSVLPRPPRAQPWLGHAANGHVTAATVGWLSCPTLSPAFPQSLSLNADVTF